MYATYHSKLGLSVPIAAVQREGEVVLGVVN